MLKSSSTTEDVLGNNTSLNLPDQMLRLEEELKRINEVHEDAKFVLLAIGDDSLVRSFLEQFIDVVTVPAYSGDPDSNELPPQTVKEAAASRILHRHQLRPVISANVNPLVPSLVSDCSHGVIFVQSGIDREESVISGRELLMRFDVEVIGCVFVAHDRVAPPSLGELIRTIVWEVLTLPLWLPMSAFSFLGLDRLWGQTKT